LLSLARKGGMSGWGASGVRSSDRDVGGESTLGMVGGEAGGLLGRLSLALRGQGLRGLLGDQQSAEGVQVASEDAQG